jgi:hypothetical protein
VRQQLLDAISAGEPFRTTLRDLALTPSQVWGLTRTDDGWSKQLETALMASRRDDLQHGTNAAYVAGCVCGECGEHQQRRMGRDRRYSSGFVESRDSEIGRQGGSALRVWDLL